MGYLTHGTTAGGKTYDLLPCPFCGSTEVYVEEYEHHPGAMRWRVFCAGCMAGVDTGTRQSASSAVQDWNRRAERTCRYVYDREICAWRCSECGGLEPVGDHVSYCPDCGAKVVE